MAQPAKETSISTIVATLAFLIMSPFVVFALVLSSLSLNNAIPLKLPLTKKPFDDRTISLRCRPLPSLRGAADPAKCFGEVRSGYNYGTIWSVGVFDR